MPVLWTAPPPPQDGTPPLAFQRIDQDLEVAAETWSYDRTTGIWEFTKGVVARFGVTTIQTEHLIVRTAEADQSATAEGTVLLTDPEGTVQADRLEFVWKPGLKRGTAENAVIRIAGVTLKARQTDITPERWELTDVYGTSCEYKVPLYAVSTPKVIVYPGKRGTVERPRLSILGIDLPALPSRSFNLDPRTQGIRLPGPVYRQDEGLGVTWDAGTLVDDRTGVTAGLSSFPGSLPGYFLQMTRSAVPAAQAQQLIAPRSELRERFTHGYFDNILREDPRGEASDLREPRQSLSIGSFWHQGASAVPTDRTFSKPLEFVAERGGQLGNAGLLAQFRLQNIHEEQGPSATRAVAGASLGLPPLKLSPWLHGLVRFDGAGHVGTGGSYGWARAQIGAVVRPTPWLTLGAAYIGSVEGGTPDFSVDRLYATNGYHLRGDLNLGPTQISYLLKYDRGRGNYDRQYIISQVVGCLEPYVLYRKFPDDYKIGVRLRIDRFLRMLSSREFKRRRPAQPVESKTSAPIPSSPSG